MKTHLAYLPLGLSFRESKAKRKHAAKIRARLKVGFVEAVVVITVSLAIALAFYSKT
jgi:hypothetical protein